MRKIKQLLVLIFACSSVMHIRAVSLDATITPTIIYTNYTFASGDFARGHVKFLNGFNVALGGDLTLDIDDEVLGTINLNQGRLHLSRDLNLGKGAKILVNPTGGTFDVNNNVINGNGRKIFFNYDLEIDRTNDDLSSIFLNDVIFSGNGNKLSLFPGAIVAYTYFGTSEPGSCGFERLKLEGTYPRYSFQKYFVGFNNPVLLRDVDFILRPDLTDLWIPTLCQGTVRFLGSPGARVTHGGFTLLIDRATEVYFGPGVAYDHVTRLIPVANIQFTDKTSRLYFDNSEISMVYSNLGPFDLNIRWTKGTVIFQGLVKMTTAATADGAYNKIPPFYDSFYEFGDGNPANDLNIQFLAGSRLVLDDQISLNVKNVK